MKNLLYLLIAILALSSCYQINESETKIPEKLLTKEELVDIITEMQITESSFLISEDMKLERSAKPKYYEAILKTYDVSLDDIRDNLNYYQSTPKVMEEIYESVLAKLSQYQSDVDLEIKELERIKDSIAQAKKDSINAVNDSLNMVVEDSLEFSE